MGPRCSSAETQVCHRSYIIAASVKSAPSFNMLLKYCHGMECIITVDCFCIEASPIAECHNTEVCIWQKKIQSIHNNPIQDFTDIKANKLFIEMYK